MTSIENFINNIIKLLSRNDIIYLINAKNDVLNILYLINNNEEIKLNSKINIKNKILKKYLLENGFLNTLALICCVKFISKLTKIPEDYVKLLITLFDKSIKEILYIIKINNINKVNEIIDENIALNNDLKNLWFENNIELRD